MLILTAYKQVSEASKDIPEESNTEASPTDNTPNYFNLKPILRPSEHTPPHTPPEGAYSSSARPGSKRVSFSEPSYDAPASKPAAPAPVSWGLRKWLMHKVPRGRKIPATPSLASARSSSKEENAGDSGASSPANSVFAFNRPGM